MTYAPRIASFVLVVQLEGWHILRYFTCENDEYFMEIFQFIFSALGRQHAWQFTKENWKEFHDRYQGGFLLSRLVKVSMEDKLLKNEFFLPLASLFILVCLAFVQPFTIATISFSVYNRKFCQS
jgi:hypothetical protein